MIILLKKKHIKKLFRLRNAFPFFHCRLFLKIKKNLIQLSKCVILFYVIVCKRNSYRKDIEQTPSNKLTKLITSYIEKSCSKSFSDASNSSDVEEEIIKQINTLKPFNMQPRKAIPKKAFVFEKENNCKGEINSTQQDRIGNIDWCKCGCKCKLIAAFAERFYLLLPLKSRSARAASSYSAFMGNCPTITTG